MQNVAESSRTFPRVHRGRIQTYVLPDRSRSPWSRRQHLTSSASTVPTENLRSFGSGTSVDSRPLDLDHGPLE